VKLQQRQSSAQFEPFVKVGIPGMGYVRFDSAAQWPPMLEVKSVNPISCGMPSASSTGNGSTGSVRSTQTVRSDGTIGVNSNL
jgi:hypothetical protein